MTKITSREIATDLIVTLLSHRLKSASAANLPPANSLKVATATAFEKPSLFHLHLRAPYQWGLVLDLECPHTLCIGEATAEGLTGLADEIMDSLQNAWAEKEVVLHHLTNVLISRFTNVRPGHEADTAKLIVEAYGSTCKVELRPAFEQVLPVPETSDTIQRRYLLPWVEATDKRGITTLLPVVGNEGAAFPEAVSKWLPETAGVLHVSAGKQMAEQLAR